MKNIGPVKIVFIALAAVLCLYSCGKKDNPITGGGKGGTTTLQITPEHAGGFVDSCKVYIKYGTNDYPAGGKFDDSAWCHLVDTTPVVNFSNLTVGLYYLYGDGVHYPYSPPFVKGGLPYTISADGGTKIVYLPTYTYSK